MAGKQVDKLKKLKYKASRLKGKSIAQSMRDAGYSDATAHLSSTEGIVKQCEPELMAEVKAQGVSVEWVIEGLTSELVAKDCRAADRIRVRELIGKYLNMFRDAQPIQMQFNINDTIERLREPAVIDITSCSASG